MAESKQLTGTQEGEPKTDSAKAEPFINWLPSARVLGAEVLPLYHAEISRAASAYILGHLDEAESILNALSSGIEKTLSNQSNDVNDVEAAPFHLLYGTVLTALGRTHERRGQDKQARSAFKKAEAEFSEWIERAPEVSAQVYCDYGVSLYKVGSKRRTIRALELAEKKGPLNAEANRYLGTCYCRMGDFEKAEKRFAEALRQEPGDFSTRKALAECLEEQGKIPEAVSEYNQVALLMTSSAMFEDAQSNAKHALELAPEDPHTLVLTGEILLARGLYEEVLETLDKGLKQQPKNGGAFRIKGRALLALGKYEEAAKQLQHALKLDPTLDMVRVELASALSNLGDFEKALKVLDEALTERPDDLDTLINKGSTLNALGRNDAALAVLDEALKISPDNAQALGIKGRVLVELKQHKKAVQALERSVKIDPANPAVFATLGATLSTLGQNDRALVALETALAIKPDYAPALMYKGETLRSLGDYQEALQVLNQALALLPFDAWALGTKGQVLRNLGRNEEAVEALQKCIELDPSLMWAHGELIIILYDLGRYEETLKALDEALRHQPYANWLAFKGHVLNKIAEFEDAVKVLNQGIKLKPDYAQVFGLKGWALENLGINYAQESLEAYQSAENLERKNLLWQTGIANALYLMKEGEKASDKYRLVIKQAKSLVKSEPQAETLALMGWSEYRLGDFKDAAQHFTDVLSINPASISDVFNLALALMCDGNNEQALGEYKRALRMLDEKSPLGRRGLLYVAIDDLKLAIREKVLAKVPDVEDIQSLLEKTYKELPKYKPSTT